METYTGLESSFKSRPGRFVQEIQGHAQNALTLCDSDRESAVSLLQSCEQRIRGQWWPFGKRAAWTVLVQAWADIDRIAALRLIGKLTRPVQEGLLSRMNNRSPLTAEEWDLAHKHGEFRTGIIAVLKELLDRDHPVLHLSADLARAVAQQSRSEVNATPTVETDEHRKAKADRDKALTFT